MNDSDIRVSFEVESMVRTTVATMWIGEEPHCKLDLSNPENIDFLYARRNSGGGSTILMCKSIVI